ncbi:hypothetical protein FKM82_010023 [Ascaphus truei]
MPGRRSDPGLMSGEPGWTAGRLRPRACPAVHPRRKSARCKRDLREAQNPGTGILSVSHSQRLSATLQRGGCAGRKSLIHSRTGAVGPLLSSAGLEETF